jgi:hypothetical protein
VPKDERRCLLRYAVDRGGLGPSSRGLTRLCGSWLEKEEDRLELGDALGVAEGGVYGIRSTVRGGRNRIMLTKLTGMLRV